MLVFNLLTFLWCAINYSQELHNETAKGQVWPIPKDMYVESDTLRITLDFEFRATGYTCNILEQAFQRYRRIIFSNFRTVSPFCEGEQILLFLDVDLRTQCNDDDLLSERSDESYELTLGFNDDCILHANSVWGALRGLESFSQLIYQFDSKWWVNFTAIKDEPQFFHRGILLDTARHFISINQILKLLDAMTYNKLNVFHWHIIDDQSFPYVSSSHPELSASGAYAKQLVYRPNDIQIILEYARVRGIRIIVEIDTPSHTLSWGKSHPEFISQCYIDGVWYKGPFNPTDSALYGVLKSLFDEIVSTFPDEFLHIGGDEIDIDCWKAQVHIRDFMKRQFIGNYSALLHYYFDKVLCSLNDDITFIAWEDLFYDSGNSFKDIVYQTWMNDGYKSAEKITKAGHRVIFSSANWYLSGAHAGSDWKRFYRVDPRAIRGTNWQKSLIIGGEACMWSEFVDDSNLHTRIWPRACAVAEKLWSPMNADNIEYVENRLKEHRCRMLKRGIPSEPVTGPGFCVV